MSSHYVVFRNEESSESAALEYCHGLWPCQSLNMRITQCGYVGSIFGGWISGRRDADFDVLENRNSSVHVCKARSCDEQNSVRSDQSADIALTVPAKMMIWNGALSVGAKLGGPNRMRACNRALAST